ncbi:hypothetical protein ERJ75_000237400 [Trypanosoma vivax]|nr:hypothetical protein ERJ75_000237400 [Trypanosoma vivax]
MAVQGMFPVIFANQGYVNDSKGQWCMTVVDPATRKLLIPTEYIYVTQAQQRSTIPSLCQLFLQGRCRQGAQCHQVHAPLEIVSALRSQVETLPWCCAEHGDRDYAGVLNEQSWVSRVVVHIADVQYEGGYIPLSRFSYTLPVSNMLNNMTPATLQAVERHLRQEQSGHAPAAPLPPIVLEASDVPICRLHVLDRCRYAEECSFLHICKEVAKVVPNIPLGSRQRNKSAAKQSIYDASSGAYSADIRSPVAAPPPTHARVPPATPTTNVYGMSDIRGPSPLPLPSVMSTPFSSRGTEACAWLSMTSSNRSSHDVSGGSAREGQSVATPISALCTEMKWRQRGASGSSTQRHSYGFSNTVSLDGYSMFDLTKVCTDDSARDVHIPTPTSTPNNSMLSVRTQSRVTEANAASRYDSCTVSTSVPIASPMGKSRTERWRHDPYAVSGMKVEE